jgi:hypothetical protein
MKTTLTLIALGFAFASIPANADTETYPGTLYRNGGHFGDANSDAKLEQAEPATSVIAGAPSSEIGAPESAPTQTWSGTLYRNGGVYGDWNSDEKLEINP